MWGKNNSQSRPNSSQNSRQNNQNQQPHSSESQDYSQDYSQNYVQDGRNPFNSDPGYERAQSQGGPASHFNAGESRDDYRWQYSPNSNPSRSGTSVTNRQGQTGGSSFTSQYGLHYGSGSHDAGSPYGTDYGRERSDYGSEHANLNSTQASGLHAGKGPKGYQRSDERIHEEANERLTHDTHIDASEIEVSVASGVVTLTGTVEDRKMKRFAEDLVETLSGVSDVRNELRVQAKNDSNSQRESNAVSNKQNSKTSSTPKSLM